MKLENINKSYGNKVIYKDFNLETEDGRITAILGESGCGKTTLLKIIANLTEFSGKVSGNIKPLSFVFQNDRLVKNLTVRENLKLVLNDVDFEKILTETGLKDVIDEYPKNLSGGMARRVAIIRALLYKSPLLLMDEPFINLDIKLKYSLMGLIKDNVKTDNRTVVFVTHDIDEALKLADRIIVLNNGNTVLNKDKEKCSREELIKTLLN